MKICRKCNQAMIWVGFERKLITRGKDKGKYTVTEYYSCKCKRK